MKYDFTSIPDRRGCGSNKWNGAKNASTEFVPLSVADMEFYPAPPIVEAIKKTAETSVLGYTSPTDEYFDAVVSWMKRRHGFECKKEWIINTPGVVNALGILIQAATKPGDAIVILTPVYYPFDMAVLTKGRKIIYSELIDNNGRYEINYTDLENKCKKAKAILFCNPHNPVGRVWSEEELKKVAEICCRNNVFIIDDEIHNDLIMPGYEHTVMAKVGDFVLDNIAICTAPSKTFNLAGIQCSNIIIPNAKTRAKATACQVINLQSGLNIFAYPVCIAAYNECEDWLDELLDVIHENALLVENFMAENFPEIKVYPLEGTYLQWLDMRALGMTYIELREMLEGAGLYLDYGEMFGPLGRGFQRINLACAKVTLEKALIRFRNAVEDVRKNWETNGKPYRKTLSVGEKLENFEYDTLNSSGNTLNGSSKTFIVFSRYYDCELCKFLLASFAAAYPAFKAMGYEIKFIMQDDAFTLAQHQKKYPFELIADPEFKLYNKYNVFVADSIVNLVAGDKIYEKTYGKNVYKILDTDMIDLLINAMGLAPENENGPRANQLCAFIAVDTDMNVTYSHYSKTISDFPEIKDIIKVLKN